MPITTTLGQLQAAADAKALATLAELVPPGAQLFRIARLLNAVEQEIAELQKQRVKLFQKFGRAELDAEGKPTGQLTMVGAAPEAMQEFGAEMNKLFAVEVTLAADPVDWSKLGEVAQAKLNVAMIRALGPLIVEGGVPSLASVP